MGEGALTTMVLAGLITLVLIVIYMIVLYRLLGVVASLTLIGQVAGMLAAVSGWFGFMPSTTLTIPGIAGIILSVGMAVDANVIIFARMKEELALGKTVRSAVEAGFNRAFIAILDANVTTMIAAVVLYYFGTGPIQGFAITLAIGTVVSMFSAIVVTKFLLRQMVGLKLHNPSLYGVKGGADRV